MLFLELCAATFCCWCLPRATVLFHCHTCTRGCKFRHPFTSKSYDHLRAIVPCLRPPWRFVRVRRVKNRFRNPQTKISQRLVFSCETLADSHVIVRETPAQPCFATRFSRAFCPSCIRLGKYLHLSMVIKTMQVTGQPVLLSLCFSCISQ